MSKNNRFIRNLKANGELWALIGFGLITGVSTLVGLLLRYALLWCFGGSHVLTLFGREMTVVVDDNFAYTVYYISSTVLMYLLKWFTSDGLPAREFLPRAVAFVVLNLLCMAAGNLVLSLLISWGVHRELAFWLTTPITFGINYLGCRLIVFEDADKRKMRRSKRLRRYKKLLKERAKSDGGKEN